MTSAYDRRVVTIPPQTALPFEPAGWRDALVVVARGTVEVETESGQRQLFGGGALIWLDRMPVRLLRNPGIEPAVLGAVARRRSSSTSDFKFSDDLPMH
jgi:hypothetical protein